jgi:hypothetical protein
MLQHVGRGKSCEEAIALVGISVLVSLHHNQEGLLIADPCQLQLSFIQHFFQA